MFNPNLFQRIWHFTHLKTMPYRAYYKNKQLNNKDFSIISNNCWGGITYEEYGLRKNSPTVGCYIFPDDYLNFISNLQHYFSLDLKFVNVKDARHYDQIVNNGNEDCPIGVLDDVEIVFVHYKTQEKAYNKWMSRVKRVNWNNLIFKFSYQNNATMEQVNTFDKMALPGKKFVFVNIPNHGLKSGVYYHGFEKDHYVWNDTFFAHRYFDVTKFLNEGVIIQK